MGFPLEPINFQTRSPSRPADVTHHLQQPPWGLRAEVAWVLGVLWVRTTPARLLSAPAAAGSGCRLPPTHPPQGPSPVHTARAVHCTLCRLPRIADALPAAVAQPHVEEPQVGVLDFRVSVMLGFETGL